MKDASNTHALWVRFEPEFRFAWEHPDEVVGEWFEIPIQKEHFLEVNNLLNQSFTTVLYLIYIVNKMCYKQGAVDGYKKGLIDGQKTTMP